MLVFRRRLVLPAVVAFAITLTACGSGNETDPAADATLPTAANTEAVPGTANGSGESPANEQGTGDGDAEGEDPGADDDSEHGDDGDDEGDAEDGDATGGDDDANDEDANDEDGDDGSDAEADTDADAVPFDSGDVPTACPAGVLKTGDRIATGFEHVEISPNEALNVLTCEWRAAGDSIASIEVSFSDELIGTNLADLDNAQEVTVAGVKGHALRSDDGKMNMFQFQVQNLFITGGSMEVDDVKRSDVLQLAKAAIQAVSG